MSGAFKLVILGVAAVVAGATAVYTAFWGPRARARKRLAAGATTIVDHTVVTLVGTVRARSTLEAPLSGAPCVAFMAIGAVGPSGHPIGDFDPRQEFATHQMVPFDLVTRDGVVFVEATTAEIVHPPVPLIPRKVELEAKFLVAHGFDARRVREATFHQAVIVDGDKIRVQGLALVEQAPPSDAKGYRETEQLVRLVAHGSHPVTIGPSR